MPALRNLMTIRSGVAKIGTALALLLATLSCGLFVDDPKPRQGVDLPAMFGKSLAELTTMLGQPKPSGICHGWETPDGAISACYKIGDRTKTEMDSLSYHFTPPTVFSVGPSVRSPEEMAALVNIDLQGRKPDNEFRGGYSYDLVLNGKTVYAAFDGGAEKIVGVRIHSR